MSRTPPPNDGMTRKELDIGDSDLSLDPVGLLDDPDGEEEEIEVLPEDPAEMLDRCLDPTRENEVASPAGSSAAQSEDKSG